MDNKNDLQKEFIEVVRDVSREIISDSSSTFRIALDEVISGFLYKDGELDDVPIILNEVAEEYKEAIKKQRELFDKIKED